MQQKRSQIVISVNYQRNRSPTQTEPTELWSSANILVPDGIFFLNTSPSCLYILFCNIQNRLYSLSDSSAPALSSVLWTTIYTKERKCGALKWSNQEFKRQFIISFQNDNISTTATGLTVHAFITVHIWGWRMNVWAAQVRRVQSWTWGNTSFSQVFSPGWARMRSLCPTASLYQYQISVKEKQQMLRCSLDKSRTSTRMQMLTASLLRRSCSLFRAISLSFSIGVCVFRASVVDFGGSASSRASNAASALTFSFAPASFLTGSRFSTVLHGSRQLKGKDALISGTQTFIDKSFIA